MVKTNLLNLTLFQIGWPVCVVGGDFYAVIFTLPALALHNWLVLGSYREWILILMIAAVGSAWDMLMVQAGIMQYADGWLLGIPLWLTCLWLLFATTFVHALSWLRHHLWLAALLAAVLGPTSYWIGANLTDASIEAPILASLAVMAAGWAALFPFGIRCAGRLVE